MKRVVLTLFFLFAAIGAVGFYRGWFGVFSARESSSERVNIGVTVDPEKVRQDADRVKERTSELTDEVTDAIRSSHDSENPDSQKPPE